MTLGPGVEPRPHWWEASALTTAPSLFPAILSKGYGLLYWRLHYAGPYQSKTMEFVWDIMAHIWPIDGKHMGWLDYDMAMI